MRRSSVYFTSKNEVEVVEETVAPVGDGEVLVRSIVSAVSAGTELLFLRGDVPRGMTVDETIPSLAGGPSRYPLKYGYAAVGRITEMGRGVDPALEGRLVFAFHPHESCFVTTPNALVELPQEMPPDKAVLLPTMETAVSLVMDARPIVGEQMVVFGLGMVGLLATHLLGAMSPGRLVGVDALALRREHAVRLGAHAALDAGATDLVDAIRDELSKSPGLGEYEGADLAIELSGRPSALDVAVQSVGFSGRVLIGSWYGTKPTLLGSLGDAFHRKHVELRSSQVSRLHPSWTGRWTKRRRLRTALDLLADLNHAPLISHRFPIEHAQDAYGMLENNPRDILQVLFSYEDP